MAVFNGYLYYLENRFGTSQKIKDELAMERKCALVIGNIIKNKRVDDLTSDEVLDKLAYNLNNKDIEGVLNYFIISADKRNSDCESLASFSEEDLKDFAYFFWQCTFS